MTTAFRPRPAEGLTYENVVRMAWERVSRTPEDPAFRAERDGVWVTVTWGQWWSHAGAIAQRLGAEHGVGPGSRVAIVGRDGVAWAAWELAIAMVGAVCVALPSSSSVAERRSWLDAADCRVVATDEEPSPQDGRTWLPMQADLPWTVAAGTDPLPPPPELGPRLRLEDLATLVTTSGTTEDPRLVALRHRNLVYAAWALRNVLPAEAGDTHLLALPPSHTVARQLRWGAVEQGIVTAFVAPDETAVLGAVLALAPTFVSGGPALFERLRRRIFAELVGPNRLARHAFELALEVGAEVRQHHERADDLPGALALRWALADKTFLGRVRAYFGPRLRFALAVGGPLPLAVATFFHDSGVRLLAGYGAAETTGLVALNRPDRFRVGSVGPALPGWALHRADDGEIYVRGHGVMAAADDDLGPDGRFADHGWLKTGDLGEIRDGFLWIHGRKRDRFTTASGIDVVPQRLEARLREITEIAHAVVGRDEDGQVRAVLALEPPELGSWGGDLGVLGVDHAALGRQPQVRERLRQRLRSLNETLPPGAPIVRFVIADRPFTESRGELSPTGEVRRSIVWRLWGAFAPVIVEE